MSQASHFADLVAWGAHTMPSKIISMSAHLKSQQVCPEYDQAVAVSGPMLRYIDPKHLCVCPSKDTQTQAQTKEYTQVDVRMHNTERTYANTRSGSSGAPSYGYQHAWSYFQMPQSANIIC